MSPTPHSANALSQAATMTKVLARCHSCGTRPTDEQLLVWNNFMEKRGWRDEDDGSTQELEAYKAAIGLAHRTDLVTLFDDYEVDEGRCH
ncbi:MAG: DUF5069 domain-containing protein [Chthoniobacteraceae bacterium]